MLIVKNSPERCAVPYEPDIDFARIRPYGQPASRANAFEELASTLIEQGAVSWPEGVQFHRFGNPDGGREGKGALPNGDVWAWQAKYLFEFDAAATGQLSASIRRVLELEPRLVRYFVSLPIDLPAGDTESRTSAFTRWNDKVAEWKALALQSELTVDFEFVGAHRLVTALTESGHAGRARYWFGTDLLTPEWQGRRLDEAIAKAGRRYSPRLNVEVETVRALDAVGRAEGYVLRWQTALAALREARRWPWRAPEGKADVFEPALVECARTLDATDAAVERMIASLLCSDPLPALADELDAASTSLREIDDLLHTHSLAKGGYFVGDAGSLYSEVRSALGGIRRCLQLVRSASTSAANERVLLLTGRAGVGKTHLLCDVARQRVAAERPTLLLLGQDFDDTSLLSQIPERLQLSDTLDDVLGLLDAAAEASHSLGLLMLDAINESERPERWKDDLRALKVAVERHPNIALVVSCRTEFVEAVVGDQSLPAVEHIGFAEATDDAVLRFTHEFGLEPPTFPVLNPEFSNPLYLKLTCEALATLGSARFPFGAAGLLTVTGAFLEAVNKRLAEPARCDYDEKHNLVAQVVRALALAGPGPLDRAVAREITDAALPGRPWSRSLLHGLLAEGVLISLSDDGRVTFGYQRLGDLARAGVIAEGTPEDIGAWVRERGESAWRERGVLGALAVIVPERHGQELLDLALDEQRRASRDVVDAFLESLLLRAPASVSSRTVDVVERVLDQGYETHAIWDRVIRIACVPGHGLNADWLHERLRTCEVWERDLAWSELLAGAADDDEETTVKRLIQWAWPRDLSSRTPVPQDVASLATQVLGWFLASNDRRVRDRATKALVSVGERAPTGFARALVKFAGVNDPYVIERLAGAACAIVLRADAPVCSTAIADALVELVEPEPPGWPLHILTRDFIRRALDIARTHGWTGADRRPPYGSALAVPTRPYEDIERLAGPPDYVYGSIWHSLTGMGDFGRYVLQSALHDVDATDRKALLHDAESAVFHRVLELGWTPGRFGQSDRGRSGHDRVVERVGKKYQWIGFYEVMGRIADNYAVRPRWSGAATSDYEYTEQLVWRDTDPTVLVRKPQTTDEVAPWFSPPRVAFPVEPVETYPPDAAELPDPLDLIAVTDADGRQWLVLVSAPSWEQRLGPEVAALRVPRRAVWMQLHAYLVPSGDAATVAEWSRGKDWFGRWMPDVPELHNLLLAAHPDAPEWAPGDGAVDWSDARAHGPQPAPLWQCAAWYGGTGTSRDASGDEETSGYVPSRRLFEALGLSRGKDFEWHDESGLAVFDPAAMAGGTASLCMRRDLVPRLDAAGLTVFWTLLAGSELHHTDLSHPGDEYRWVSASAAYMLNASTVECISAAATRCRPGPVVEAALDWPVRPGEA